MKKQTALLAASVLFLSVPAVRTSSEEKRSTKSTDRMRLGPTMGASLILPSTANHAPPLPNRIVGKAGASTICRMCTTMRGVGRPRS